MAGPLISLALLRNQHSYILSFSLIIGVKKLMKFDRFKS
jgi:hypothetical protein